MIKLDRIVITLGRSMSNFANVHYINKYFDKYYELKESVYCGVKGNNSVIIYQVNSNWKRLSYLLQKIEKPKECFGVGFVGSLKEEIGCGQLIIPSIAVNDEMVPGGIGQADKDLITRVKEISSSQISFPSIGKIYTVNSLADESPTLISKLIAQEYLGIDMESSYLMSFFSRLYIPCAVILVVSDNILINPLNPKNKERHLPLTPKVEVTAKKAILIACETIFKKN